MIYASKDGSLSVIMIDKTKAFATYLKVAQEGEEVQGVILVERESLTVFLPKFTPSPDPVEAFAKIYRQHATEVGISPEAEEALSKLITITEGTTRVPEATTAKTPKTPKAKAAPKKAEMDTSVVSAKVAEKLLKTKVIDHPNRPASRPSVSSRFCELIMEGKRTDREIFAIVQKEYDLDDKKKNYVAWNRNHLTKLGKNPPAAMPDGDKRVHQPLPEGPRKPKVLPHSPEVGIPKERSSKTVAAEAPPVKEKKARVKKAA